MSDLETMDLAAGISFLPDVKEEIQVLPFGFPPFCASGVMDASVP
jgi:hypothetical protein